MLTLIGLGLCSEKDLTLKGVEKAKEADRVYVELYTSKWHGNIKNFEELIGKKIYVLKRKDLEENSDKILGEAKDKKIILFVPGDPLIATTHASLLLEAKKKEIETRIIHNASIYSAIGEIGLHVYKFGATATVPFPEKNAEPVSVYDVIKQNKKLGLHTLLLLDIDVERDRYMDVKQAMRILLKIEAKRKEGVFNEDIDTIVFARAGSDNPLIVYGKVKDLLRKDFGKPPFVIIVPGKLHFVEKEYLEHYRVKNEG